jgi:hypothetical protein
LIRDLLRPALKDEFLVLNILQRMKYLNWFHVYAKDSTRLLACMAVLVDEHKVRALHVVESAISIF